MGARFAVILVGGKGTRLHPLTKEMPKALIPVHGKPILAHFFDALRRHGIVHAYLCVGHMKEGIKNHFKDGSAYGMHLEYIEEDEPLGTAGPLRLGRDHLTETFVCSNGDELKDIDLDEMFAYHKSVGAKVTIALRHVDDPSRYGVAKLEGNRIAKFVEKPTKQDAPSNLINSGLYLIEPDVIDMIPPGFCMLEQAIFPKLAGQGALFGFPFSGQWFDTGTSERYAKALCEWEDIRKDEQPYKSVDHSIFKEHDIYGAFPTQINPDTAFAISKAFMAHLQPQNMIIGRDAHPSSKLLFDTILCALRDGGVEAIDIGECNTSFFSNAMIHKSTDAGIMITAPYNPMGFNNLKLAKKNGMSISNEEDIPQMLNIIQNNAFNNGKERKKRENSKDNNTKPLMRK